ncbi:MAG: transcription-repair coupling factor [Dehalococcoidia bacterium]
MSIANLLPILEENNKFKSIVQKINSSKNFDMSLFTPAKDFFLAAFLRTQKTPSVIITESSSTAHELYDRLFYYLGDDFNILNFPDSDDIYYENFSKNHEIEIDRIRCLASIEDYYKSNSIPIIISSINSISNTTIDRSVFKNCSVSIKNNEEKNLKELVNFFISIGYDREPIVDVPGILSVRGGIIDIYSPNYQYPVRIEFYGDTIETIRFFHPETQRSISSIENITIIPTREILTNFVDKKNINEKIDKLDFSNCFDKKSKLKKEIRKIIDGENNPKYSGFYKSSNIFEYITDDFKIINFEKDLALKQLSDYEKRVEVLRKNKEERGEIPYFFPLPRIDTNSLKNKLKKYNSLNFSEWDKGESGNKFNQTLFSRLAINIYGLDEISNMLHSNNQKNQYVFITNHKDRLLELFNEKIRDDIFFEKNFKDKVSLIDGHISNGFQVDLSNENKLIFFSDLEIFGIKKQRIRSKKKRFKKATKISELKKGIFVVHIDHGVAKFLGTKLKSDNNEYLELLYANKDKLYIPTEHLDRIQIYKSGKDDNPRLTRLGTQEWINVKRKIYKATEKLASELIDLYAFRKIQKGYSFEVDSSWQNSLESSFPFQETDDQITTLNEVKADMELPSPMDRLVCGDVGYGKTEVALRSAFKAAQSGKQVAILVPTTVLAQQHFETFISRLQPFPVNINVLSRFKSKQSQREIVEEINNGSIDIVIGTHRLIQKDIKFKNLGLLIIDEEHKFGVSHKEFLSRFYRNIDILSLSATPIPRTLQMSLSGIRDMSTIETPPNERIPIKTFISDKTDSIISEAILREKDRGGQVFFLHNRVNDIDVIYKNLSKILPQASINIAHGQMDEKELEKIMHDFGDKKFDVLLCTTIIESGIDFPNVNTLIVDDADKFGLSQLYQIRGRIGRGNVQGYAYLLKQKNKSISELSQKKLNTILSANELGSGYQIALRDLEIRGVGNLLGSEQSGYISAVGFELYTKLLSDSVENLLENKQNSDMNFEFNEVTLDLRIDSRIPDSYVLDLSERLMLYQRIARISNNDKIDDFEKELRDRFGKMPRQVKLLLQAQKIKIYSKLIGISIIAVKEKFLTISFEEPIDSIKLYLSKIFNKNAKIGYMQVKFSIKDDNFKWLDELINCLIKINDMKNKKMKIFNGN